MQTEENSPLKKKRGRPRSKKPETAEQASAADAAIPEDLSKTPAKTKMSKTNPEEAPPILEEMPPLFSPEDKLLELLHCGNERIELSAAKELIALKEAEQEKRRQEEEAEPLKIEVRIRIEQQEDGREDVKA